MNQQQLDDILVRLETVGSVKWTVDNVGTVRDNNEDTICITSPGPFQPSPEDAARAYFIATAPQDVRNLLSEVERLRAEYERVGKLYNAALIERDDLRETLKWYADTSNYTPEGIAVHERPYGLLPDTGILARKALDEQPTPPRGGFVPGPGDDGV